MDLKNFKFVIVGDGMVGKTSLLSSFANNSYDPSYVPTIFDSSTIGMEVDNIPYTLTLWDTAGQEEYANLRKLSYPETDVFLLCFAIDNPTTFDNIKSKWLIEITTSCPEGKIMLVGTKSDVRKDSFPSNIITSAAAEDLAHQIGAFSYKECSAITQDGLKDVFESAVREMVKSTAQPKKKDRHKCIIL
jgi:small GTP-binding protein